MKDIEKLFNIFSNKYFNKVDENLSKPNTVGEFISFKEIKEFFKTNENDEFIINRYKEFAICYIVEYMDKFCSCGDKEEIRKYILKWLNCFNEISNNHYFINREKYIEIFQKDNFYDSVENEFMLKWLDSENYSTHGSSVWSSWLTEKGEFFKEVLTLYVDYLKED